MLFCRKSILAAWIVAGAALLPTNAPAATLRMIIQSPEEVGGKCIDIPNGKFLPGIRVQMWDCMNGDAGSDVGLHQYGTVGQIFSYDDTKQQLTIGNLCVESWGRGDPGDAVGLGSCDGGPKQHWKMVASKDHYQIIGINDRCLALRYAVKDNGAPLNIQDCNVSSPHRLWVLIEAPPASSYLVGTWKSNWGPVTIQAAADGPITGSWAQKEGVGILQQGVFDPNAGTLVFSMYQPWNKATGTASFKLSADGKALAGTWSVTRENGSRDGGPWTLTK